MFWIIVLWGFLGLLGFVVVGFISLLVSESKTWANLMEWKLKRHKLKNPDKYKTDAFVAGYKHVAEWCGIQSTTEIEVLDQRRYNDMAKNPYVSASLLRSYKSMCTSTETVSRIDLDKFNSPSARDYDIREVAVRTLDQGFEIDLSKALDSRKYLAGGEDEFKQYYAGGVKFMADVSEMEAIIVDQRLEKKKGDLLVEARKKGLREVGTRLSEDMRQLTDARARILSPESVEAHWERLMVDAGEPCADQNTVVS